METDNLLDCLSNTDCHLFLRQADTDWGFYMADSIDNWGCSWACIKRNLRYEDNEDSNWLLVQRNTEEDKFQRMDGKAITLIIANMVLPIAF